VLRVAPYGESDAVVTLLTAREGVVPAIARRARGGTSKRRVIVEPFHTLLVEIAPGGGELAHLRSSSIAVPRAALLEDARALDVAGTATRWARLLSPPRAPEPDVFEALESLLDALVEKADPEGALATFGLRLLDALGYGLELSACARCARPRPAGRAAYVTAQGGGVVCDVCRFGVAGEEPPLPGDLLDAVARDPSEATHAPAEQAAELLRIVRAAIDLRARAVGSKKGAL
jgi:DNA repair protein RecO (recombination protein O)